MINRITSLFLVLVLVACGGEAPVTSGSDTPVPGQDCAEEGAYGGQCSNGTCPNGLWFSRTLTCRARRWTCVDDTWRCQSVSTMCRESDRPTRCDNIRNVFCPGTNIPVEGVPVCQNGEWRCYAQLDQCPAPTSDAGTTNDAETDAGQLADAQVSDASANDAEAEPRLSCQISYDGPPSAGFAPGVGDARLLRFRLLCSEDVELRELPVVLEARTTDERIVSSNRQLVASNVRLISDQNGETLLSPLTIRPEAITSNLGAVAGRLQGGAARFEANHLYYLAIAVTLPQRVDPELFGRRFRIRIGENGRFFTDRSLYRVERGTFFTENPNNGFVPQVEGNLMWIEQPRVSVSLSNFDARQTVTRNTRDIFALGVQYSSFGSTPVFPVRVRYTGVADLGAGLRSRNFPRAIVSCSHNCSENGATPRFVPDSDGRLTFDRFTGPILNSTRSCTIICATDSVVDGRDGDVIALGIANPSDVQFEDQYGNPVLVDLNQDLQRQLTAPSHTVTIVSAGYLTVASLPVPNREITSPVDAWLRIGSYALNLSYEDGLLSTVGIRIDGASRCANELMVQTSTGVPATAFVPYGMSHVDVYWSSPVAVGIGSMTLDVFVRVNPAVDPIVNPNGCHSGDSFTVSIDYGDTSREWGSFFGSATNLRMVGTNSGLLMQYGGRPGLGGTLSFR